jgi:hypothetical protein
MNLFLAIAGVVLGSALTMLLVWALLRFRRAQLHARRSEPRKQAQGDGSLRSPAPSDSRATQPSATPNDRSPAVPQPGAGVSQCEELPSLNRSETSHGTSRTTSPGDSSAEASGGTAAIPKAVGPAGERIPRTPLHPADAAPPQFSEAAKTVPAPQNGELPPTSARPAESRTHDETSSTAADRVTVKRVEGRTSAPVDALPGEGPATENEPGILSTSLASDDQNVLAGHDEAFEAPPADFAAPSAEVIPGSLDESRADAGSASADTSPPTVVAIPASTGEASGSQDVSREAPARTRAPRQYRPAARTPGAPRAAPPDSEERPGRDRALPIEVRLVFERAGFCRVSLLPRRTPALPEEITISGSGDPLELIALQDEWYEDVVLLDTGALLRGGIEWQGTLSDGRIVRWSLSGRELYVLSRHGDFNGFVSTPKLLLGEPHVVLCTAERLQEVGRAIELTGSPAPATLDGTSGMPPGWVGLRGVVPRAPVAPSPLGDGLDALRPLADVEIVLEGGIRLERLTWLSGYPPRIRLRGDVGAIGNVVIDGQEAALSPDGKYVVPGWDLAGQHQVWCASASRSYSIREGAEDWEAWDAYTWSTGGLIGGGEQNRAAICGVLVRPPRVAGKESRTILAPASNPILLGAVPGQIQACGIRRDVRAETCIGFVWFDSVWAIPADALLCDKRAARVVLIGDPLLVDQQDPPRGASREHARRIEAWCSAILTAGRKGLRTEPARADVAALWQEYRRRAKTIWRGLR